MRALVYPERVKGDFWEEAPPEGRLEGGADGLKLEKRKKGFLGRWSSGCTSPKAASFQPG